MAYLDRHKILSEFQRGFLKHCSCETQLLLTIYDFNSSLEAGEQLDAVALDFSKAFDKLPHIQTCSVLSLNGYSYASHEKGSRSKIICCLVHIWYLLLNYLQQQSTLCCSVSGFLVPSTHFSLLITLMAECPTTDFTQNISVNR